MTSSLRDHLLAIREKNGYLDPELVVAEAKLKSHPLHDRFEWDDKIAGHKYRVQQAHELIRVVRVPHNSESGPTDVRAFLAIPRVDSPQPVYEPVEEVLMDDVRRQIVLSQMQREIGALKARYGHLVEFGDALRGALTKDAA